MKVFKNVACQGDLMLRRIESLPENAVEIKPTDGRHICAHSETGHSHVIAARQNVSLYTTGDPQISYLQVIEATDAMETVLEHLRSFDTHESISIGAGIYELRRQREYTPEGWRQVQD